jgi:threonylcarbamoyladenosine tRNA methylthiotransferase MtaB
MIVGSGCPEIVLTGVHLGLHEDLPQLVREIGAIKGLKRLRFGSIEPFAVDERLLESIKETETFCRHLHIPLQSGDDGVLVNMRRGYSTKEFSGITDNIRKKLGEDVHLSTDLMVGFPGEDEKAFENSIRFINDIGFGKMHIFNYSPREGTVAAQMACPPENEVKQRLGKALREADILHRNYCSKWIGRDVEILVEQKIKDEVRGLARNYIRIASISETAEIGEEIKVTPRKYINGILTSAPGSKCTPDNPEFPEFL